MTTEKLENFLKRNYNLHLEQKEKQERLMKERKEKLERGSIEMAKPTLSKGTQQIMNLKHREDIPSFEALYNAAKVIQNRKLEKQQERKNELDVKELNDATFHPLLISKYRNQDQNLNKM